MHLGGGRPGHRRVRARDPVGDHLDDRRRRAHARRRPRPPDPPLRPHHRQPDRAPTSCSPTARRCMPSADEHPDLFWALRGGGGNFGVVTSFEFRTHPVGATVMAGPTFWPIEQTPEVMRFYREFLPAAPRAVNGFFAAMTVPPVDLFPAELHMRKVCAVMWCIVGSEEEAARLLAPVARRRHATAARRRAGPAPCPPEPVRRALHQGPAVLLARGLRQRAVRRADRAAPRVGPEAAVDALDHAPLSDRRGRPRRRRRRHRVQLPRRAMGRGHLRRRSRPGQRRRRSATGASATGTRRIPTRPAARTSTS